MKPQTFLLLACFANLPAFGQWVNVTGTLAGSPSACGGVYCLAAVPGQNKVVTGICGDKGLFATTDNGTSWQPMGTSTLWSNPSSILFDKDNSNIFWESGIWNSWIHKTTDGGATFSIIGATTALTSHNDGISVDMTDPLRKTMVAGWHEGSNVSKSTDGGATWASILNGLSGWTSWPIVVNSQTYVVGCPKEGIYRTTNGGTSWTKVSSLLPGWNPLVASNGDFYWMASGNQAILRSTDKGLTWTSIAKPGNGQANYYTPMEMADGSIVAIGQTTLVQSSDNATWKNICTAMPTPAGLTQGNVSYNSGAAAFFIALWDCTNAIPAQAIWKHSFGTPSATKNSSLSPSPISKKQQVTVVAGRQKSLRIGGTSGVYDLYGRKLHSIKNTGNGISILR